MDDISKPAIDGLIADGDKMWNAGKADMLKLI